jgi:DNA-binding CsgD family transcriptional regulator
MKCLVQLAQMPIPVPPPFIAARLRSIEARAFDALGERDAATRVLESAGGLDTVDRTITRLLFATAREDMGRAQAVFEKWPAECAPFGELEHDVWTAVIASLSGRREAALEVLADAAARAEHEGNIRLFLDAGPEPIRLARELLRAQPNPNPYLRAIVDAGAVRPTRRVVTELTDQLSTRELAVLRYLPSRMVYADIAREMFISTSTLKTHVRHICQKLGVSGRDAIVHDAERLGLL